MRWSDIRVVDKMTKLNNFKLSLKRQLLIYFFLVSFIPVCIISLYYYNSTKAALQKNMVESSYSNISNVLDNVDKQVEQANNLTDWIYVDKDIINLLNRSPIEANIYDDQKKQTIENIRTHLQYIPVTKYISSFFIIGSNGLDIRSGIEASLININDFVKSIWFTEGQKLNGEVSWGNINLNYTKITNNKYIIPQYRTIKNLDNGKILGYSVVFFNQGIFNDCYEKLLLNQDEKIYLVDALGNILSTNQPIKSGCSIASENYFGKVLKNNNQQYFEEKIDNKINIITYKKSAKTGIILIEIIPMTQIEIQKDIIKKTLFFLVAAIILMCLFLSIFLSENYTRPIKTIVEQVNDIAHGKFDRPISLDKNNEIGELGRSILIMRTNIKNLLQVSIRKEKEKRVAEIKMLQSQINPHFLYNTLNSIKLMAKLQNAKGIETMIGSLGHLLKAALSDLKEVVPLKEELDILDDYIYIQKIRYKGKIQFEKNISDEKLLNCSVIKFILQPILENTILHGLQPKNEEGKVIISVYERNTKLIIDLWDNGIGMSKEKINNIKTYSSNGIGFNNINKRIKLVYGEAYGLEFDSELGEFTKVSVILPIQYYSEILEN